MLNDRPVPRAFVLEKDFRPARVVLRPRTRDTRDAAPARLRHPDPVQRRAWLRPALVVGLLTALAVGTVVSTGRAHDLTGLATAAQARVAVLAQRARATWRFQLHTADLVRALDDAQRQNDRLRLQLQQMRALDAERLRLAHLLQASAGQGLAGVAARVVARGGGGRQTVRLDAGVERGVEPGLPVIDTHGLAGQVVAAGNGWADVLCVTDPSHGLDGVLQDGPHGMLRGTGDALAMDHVLSRFDVKPGTPVRTSGQGGVFPPDLPVGVVVSAAPDPGTPFLSIEVRPVAPPALLDDVLVVTGRTERPEVAFR